MMRELLFDLRYSSNLTSIKEVSMARSSASAPKQITWVICLVLYIVALVAHFGVVQVSRDIAVWSWIIGYGLLLIAAQVRNL